MNILGIDIGGSALKGAPVNIKTGRLLTERHRIPTPEALTPKQMAAAINRMARHFKWKGPVGVGFPGVIHDNVILTSANLHKDFIGCDAGRGVPGAVLLLTFGTGVGSALFVDGKLYPNSEFGHLPFRGEDAERLVSAAAKDRKNLSYKKWAHKVSAYLHVLENVLWPRLIIVGGGISADHEKWFKHLKVRTPVVAASFLNEAGIVGAALSVRK